MLERSKGNRFLNTKFDVIDGTDYTCTADKSQEFRSKSVIYSWIQGRGAESLAGHLRAGFGEKSAVLEMLKCVVGNMEEVRNSNQGRMFFMFSEDGRFLNHTKQQWQSKHLPKAKANQQNKVLIERMTESTAKMHFEGLTLLPM